MNTHGEAETLSAKIAELKSEIEQARNELYALSTSYAASHFKVQSSMQALGVERLRRAGMESELAVVRRRCHVMEESIAALRAILATAGLDPDD